MHYGRAVLADTGATTAAGRATVTQADLRHPDQVLAGAEVSGLLDFTRPVAVLLIGVLHFVAEDDDPAAILAGYRAALAPDSILVLAQSSSDYPEHPELAAAVRAANDRYTDTSTPGQLRSRAELAVLSQRSWHRASGSGTGSHITCTCLAQVGTGQA